MDSLSSLLINLQIVAYVKVSFLMLLVYDTILHFDEEYLYVWKSRWSVIKVLYLWARYGTFVDSIIAVQERVDFNRDVSSCNHIMTFTTIFAGFGIGVAEIILMIRTYALYDRSKKLLAFFFLLWFSLGGVNFWAIVQWTGSFKTEAAPSSVVACYIGGSSGVGLVCYASLLAGESIIVFLTLWKGLRNFHHQQSELVSSFYRDGVLFYLAILPFSVANVIILFRAPPGLSIVADTPLRVMHTILCCHLVTHVRAVATRGDEFVGTGIKSAKMVFAERPSAALRSVGTDSYSSV